MLRRFCLALGCLLILGLSGCAELDRKIDIALYGSEEEARLARESMEVSNNEQFLKQQKKLEEKLFEKINEERKRNKVKERPYHDELHNLARMRAGEIAQRFSKTRPNGTHYKTSLEEFRSLEVYKHSPSIELRLKGYSSADAVIKRWLTDSETRKELLDDKILFFAVAVYKENSNYYWVFWSKKRN